MGPLTITFIVVGAIIFGAIVGGSIILRRQPKVQLVEALAENSQRPPQATENRVVSTPVKPVIKSPTDVFNKDRQEIVDTFLKEITSNMSNGYYTFWINHKSFYILSHADYTDAIRDAAKIFREKNPTLSVNGTIPPGSSDTRRIKLTISARKQDKGSSKE